MLEIGELAPRERAILSIDTSNAGEAERWVRIAKEAGTRIIKCGGELESAISWGYCADLAAEYDMDWIADYKGYETKKTMPRTVKNIVNKEHPPFAITIHAKSLMEHMILAREAAGETLLIAVTELTDIPDDQTGKVYGLARREIIRRMALEAHKAGVKAVTTAADEVQAVRENYTTKDLLIMVPGSRSVGSNTHNHTNTDTPFRAMKDGADLVIAGRQVTDEEDVAGAFETFILEVEEGSKHANS